jgi:hypothetical protein
MSGRRLVQGLLMAVVAAGPAGARVQKGLVVHEWGTFTSIAGENGVPVEWDARKGPKDLPSFVYTAEGLVQGRGDRTYKQYGKGDFHLVRMETPVLYFYSDEEREVSVRVDFPKGRMTEWYPHALTPKPGDGGFIDWGRFRVVPALKAPLFAEAAASHYYAAREVDASELQVCGGQGTEVEKFLFYRGVGDFALPLRAHLEGGRVAISGASAGRAMIFERKGDRVGYRWVEPSAGGISVDRPVLSGSLPGALEALQADLASTGLYPKEAAAMIKTWRDQWFEEGLRVFYVLPRADTDAVLPLHIDPVPQEVVRTLVGRLELLTPEQEQAMRSELDRLHEVPRDEADRQLFARFGRFTEPLRQRVASQPSCVAHPAECRF